jgi:hypothetical protein
MDCAVLLFCTVKRRPHVLDGAVGAEVPCRGADFTQRGFTLGKRSQGVLILLPRGLGVWYARLVGPQTDESVGYQTVGAVGAVWPG